MLRKKIKEKFKLKEIANPGGTISWQVSGTTSEGERIRRQFTNKLEARQYHISMEGEEREIQLSTRLQQTRLDNRELVEAEATFNLCVPRSPLAIVREYLHLEKRAESHGLDLSKAMAYFEKHYSPELEEISLHDAVERFLDSKMEKQSRTQASYATALNLLRKEVNPNNLVSQTALDDIENILLKYENANTRKSYKRSLHTFFEWCLKRKFVLENPVRRLDPIESDRTEISILSLDEVKRLLTAVITWKDGKYVPYFTIGLFAGLRPSEIEELRPSDIRNDQIMVRGGKLRRTHSRRTPIPSPLNAWLEEYPFTGYQSGLKRQYPVIRKATKAEKWVQDIIRHTSISYQLERDKDEALVTHNNGTSKIMLDAHYRQIIETDEEIETFWSLTPEKIRSLKLEVELPSQPELIEWPSKRALAAMIRKNPVTHVAKNLGVSDHAVRKHCKKLNLDLPSRGYWQKKRAG